MVTVHLHQLVMHAFHGVYEEEHKTGNNYELNVDVKYEPRRNKFENIRDVISYEDLYTIVKKAMEQRVDLLERVCDEIIDEISYEYANVTEVSVSIYKLQPPIENLQGKVGVTMTRKF